MEKVQIKLKGKDIDLPGYDDKDDMGIDLRANDDYEIRPQCSAVISTGVYAQIPKNCIGLVGDRLGITSKYGVYCLPLTINSMSSDEAIVLLFNANKESFYVEKGMRVGQLFILPALKSEIEIVSSKKKK